MGCLDGIIGSQPKVVSVLKIGLMHVYHLMYFFNLLLFITHVSSLDKLRDLLLYFSLTMIHYMSAELLHVG